MASIKSVRADGGNTAGDGYGSEAGAMIEGIHTDSCDTAWDDDGGKLIATIKRIVCDFFQSGEILQLVEGGDELALEHIPQIGHCGGLGIAQLAVAVGVPVVHADGFHGGVGEDDV